MIVIDAIPLPTTFLRQMLIHQEVVVINPHRLLRSQVYLITPKVLSVPFLVMARENFRRDIKKVEIE
jgi:hypothetical protein